MKVLTCVIILLSGVLVTAQVNTNVYSCDEGGILPDVKFTGKNDVLCIEQPCEVHPGSDIGLSIIFKSPRYLENIKPNIRATALGIKLDYPLFQDNACDGIVNTYCPLVKDEIVEYKYIMHLLNIFPEVTVGLKFTIMDKDTNSAVVCFNVDIVVVIDD